MNLIKTFLLLLLAAVAAFAAAGPSAAAEITLEPIQLAPHTYYFRGQPGMASKENRGFMSNAGFVVTSEGVVVFDALATRALGEAMLAAIRTITPLPVTHVIVSHYHADHFYGLEAFKAHGAQIWAHRNGRATLESDLTARRLAERRSSLAPWVNESTRLVGADRWLDFGARRQIDFTVGNQRFRIIDTSGAHSPEDIMLYVEGEGVLFAGDLFFTGRLPFVGEADSKVWLGALERLLDTRPKLVVPGHGAASARPLEDLALTRDYLLFLRKEMGSAVADLLTFEEAYAKVDWSAFDKQPAFREANRINAYGTYLLMEKESLQK